METQCIDQENPWAPREDEIEGYVVMMVQRPSDRYFASRHLFLDQDGLALTEGGRFGNVCRARVFGSLGDAQNWVKGFLQRRPARERDLYDFEIDALCK